MEIRERNSQSNHELSGMGSKEAFSQAEQEMLQALKHWPEQTRAATEQPQYFWKRQQAGIRSRIAVEEASKRPLTGFVWATVLGLALLAGVVLNTATKAPPVQQQVQVASEDDELLVQVEQRVQSNVPEALAPAALLANDISSAVEPGYRNNRIAKETPNEN